MSIIERFVNWISRGLYEEDLRRVRRIGDTLDLVDRELQDAMRKKHQTRVELTRMLLSAAGNERHVIRGTEEEIEGAAQRMSVRTKSCVAVLVMVGHYHVRGCDDLPAGGLEHLEN